MSTTLENNNSKGEPHLAVAQNEFLQTFLFAHSIYLCTLSPGPSISAAQDF